MAGQGPLAIREIARRVERDVRAVHSDVRALHLSGVIDKTPEGRMILPYEVIRLDFTFASQNAA
jgi:predicted transcriptional regulator